MTSNGGSYILFPEQPFLPMETSLTDKELRELRLLIATRGESKPTLLEKGVLEIPILTLIQIRQFFADHGVNVFLPFPERFQTTLDSLLPDEGPSMFIASINNPSGQITDQEIFEAAGQRCFSSTRALSVIIFLIAKHLSGEKVGLSLERTNIFCVAEGGVKRKYYLQLQPSNRWMIVCEEKTEVEPWPSGTTVVCTKVLAP